MAQSPLDPFALLDKSQRLALKVVDETATALLGLGRTATNPEEAIRQITALIGAVGDLASATAQPLQDFITRQRELADMMATLASAQADLAQVVESIAEKHAAIVESLETVTAPVLGLVIKESPEA